MDDRTNGGSGEIARGLEEISDRLTCLVAETVEKWDVPPDRADAIISEFATGMEELRVAEEELVVQADQLAASQRMIDAERERFVDLFESAPDGYLETDEMGKILEANHAAVRILGVPNRFLTGKLVQSFTSPDDRRRLRQVLSDAVRGAEVQEVLVELSPRHSPPLWVEIRVAGHYDPVIEQFRVRWLLRDVSERMKLERELAQLHVSVELLGALSEVNRLVEGEADALTSVLSRLVELAHRMVPADAGILLAEEEKRVVVRATAGPSAPELCDLQVAFLGPAIQTQQDGAPRSLTVADLEPWPQIAAAARRHDVRLLICHPIHHAGRVIGTLSLYIRDDLADGEQMARLLADNAGASIANAEVYAGARKLADGLAVALESRGVIEQAKGILIAMKGCSPDEAFEILRAASQRQNRKLRLIAEEIVTRVVQDGPQKTRRPPPRL